MENEQQKSETFTKSRSRLLLEDIEETPIKKIIKNTLNQKNEFNLLIKDNQTNLRSPIATYYSKPIVINRTPQKIITKIIRYDNKNINSYTNSPLKNNPLSRSISCKNRFNYEISQSNTIEINKTRDIKDKSLTISSNNFGYFSLSNPLTLNNMNEERKTLEFTDKGEKSNIPHQKKQEQLTFISEEVYKDNSHLNQRNIFYDYENNPSLSKSGNNFQNNLSLSSNNISSKKIEILPKTTNFHGKKNKKKLPKNLSKFILNTSHDSKIKKISLTQIENNAKNSILFRNKKKKLIQVSAAKMQLDTSALLNKSYLMNKNKISTILNSSNRVSISPSSSLMFAKTTSKIEDFDNSNLKNYLSESVNIKENGIFLKKHSKIYINLSQNK